MNMHQRRHYAALRRAGQPAHKALAAARQFNGTCYGPETVFKRPFAPFGLADSEGLRATSHDDASTAFRFVGNVDAAGRGAPSLAGSGVPNGWYDNHDGESFRDGTGLIWGTVWQGVARDGRPVFYGGVQHGNSDGVAIDLAHPFEGFADDTAPSDVVWHADGLAETAAGHEREYNAAWQAGTMWNDAREDAANAAKSLRETLAERRAQRAGAPMSDTLADMFRGRIANLWHAMHSARNRAVRLADGDEESQWWHTGNPDHRAAFNEGAGETVV